MIRRREKFVITFHTTTEAMAMEACAKKAGAPGRLIPVPKEITAGCGMAWSVDVDEVELIKSLMDVNEITPEAMQICMV